MSAIRLVLGCRSNQWEDCRLGPRSVCTAAELRAVDLSSSHQFEEEIGISHSQDGIFGTDTPSVVLKRLTLEFANSISVAARTRLFFIADRKGISVEPCYDHGNIVFTTTLVGFINQFSARFGDTI